MAIEAVLVCIYWKFIEARLTDCRDGDLLFVAADKVGLVFAIYALK